jgi:hypothetical protein
MARLALDSWDNWLPVIVVILFVPVAVVVGTGTLGLGMPSDDVDRFQTVYTDIGIQTTAGVFAIVISLSLVAIQFAAQEYGHRIMQAYIKSVVFWLTLILYLGIIVVGIFLQAASTGSEDVRLPSLVIIGSVAAIVLLVPYFLITAAYLRPEFIIGKLIKRVDANYLRVVGQTDALPSSLDRLLPVVEIIERAIDRGDLATTREALTKVYDLYNDVTARSSSNRVDRYFIDHLKRIGRRAVITAQQEEAGSLVVEIMGRIGAQGPAEPSVDSIETLAMAALKSNTTEVAREAQSALRAVAESTANPDVTAHVLSVYREMASRLAAQDEEQLLQQLIVHVNGLASNPGERWEKVTLGRCLDLLEVAGHAAAVRRMNGATLDAGRALAGMAAAEPEVAEEAILRLLRIEQVVDRGEREVIAALEFARGEATRMRPLDTPGDGQEHKEPPASDSFSDLWR